MGREDISPGRPDNDDQTLLLWAVQNGHDRVAELLLEREDVTPDWGDNSSKTPLLLAAESGRDRLP